MKLEEARQLVGRMVEARNRRRYRWRELSRWICPYRGVFEDQQDFYKRGDRELLRFTHIASQAVLRGASGMTSGMTPKNISWFKPDFTSPAILEMDGARKWLDEMDRLMKDCLSAGGFYQAIQSFNIDLLWAGCALLFTEVDEGNPLRYECPQVGTWCIAASKDGSLDAVARRMLMTPVDMEATFGAERMSENARRMLERQPYDTIPVWHLVKRERVEQFEIGSWWWEEGSREDFLKTSGYYEMPFFFTCWHEGTSPYGTGPGDEALADARQIDKLERCKLEGICKLVDPPMSAPSSMKGFISLREGAINYLPNQQEKITALYDLSSFASSVGYLRDEIATVAQRLEQTLMANIFSSVSMDQRPRDMSATEFLERKREALQQLGPVISAYEPNVLAPLLFRTAQAIDRNGLTPLPPDDIQEKLQGQILMKLEFISPMANALRQTGAETTRALFAEVASMAQATGPEILDKIDVDQMVDELATGLGAAGSIIRSDEAVAQIRQQRAQAEQAQQQMQMALQQAQIGQAQAGAYQQQAEAAMAMEDAQGEGDGNPLAAMFGG